MKTSDMKVFKETIRKTIKEAAEEKVFNSDKHEDTAGLHFHQIHAMHIEGNGYTHIIFNGKKFKNVNDNAEDAWADRTGRPKHKADPDH